MSIRWFKTFIAVARQESFAGAANHLGLTQAAVSIQMKALEGDLRTRLFDRSGRAIVLNTAGRALLPRAEELVRLYEDVGTSLDDGRLGGVIALGAIPPTFANSLPDSLVLMRERHPGVVVHVSTGVSSDLFQKVARGELDAALVAEPPHKLPQTLAWRPLLSEPLVLLTHRAVKVKSLGQTLADLPFIGISQESWTGRLIHKTLRQHGIKLTATMELDALDTIGAMVARGFGVSIMPLSPSPWARDERVRVTLLRPQVVRRIGLLYRRGQGDEALITALEACLLALPKPKVHKMPSIPLAVD